jgi:hypothetical protein
MAGSTPNVASRSLARRKRFGGGNAELTNGTQLF